MKTITFDNTQDWLTYRLGRITGSRLGAVLPGKTKGSLGAEMWKIVAEHMAHPFPEDIHYTTWGNMQEPYAIMAYEKKTGYKVPLDKFMWQDEDEPMIATTPDGDVVNEPGFIEIKSKMPHNHLQIIDDGIVPKEHLDQIINAFIVNKSKEWCDFIAWCPLMYDENLQLFVKRITRAEISEQIEEKERLLRGQIALARIVIASFK